MKNKAKYFEPTDALNAYVDAFNRGDLQAALNLYESKASLFVETGKILHGKKSIKNIIEKLMAQKPIIKIETSKFTEDSNIVACCTRWELKNSIDITLQHQTFISAEILRRQADGSWLISVHSPWGKQFLDESL